VRGGESVGSVEDARLQDTREEMGLEVGSGEVGAGGIDDWGLEGGEEDAGRDAPQMAWGKMPQPQRPVDGLGQDAPATRLNASHDTRAPWHAAALGRDGRRVPRTTGLGAMDGGRFADWPPMSRANSSGMP
jgi:hypothetical protein